MLIERVLCSMSSCGVASNVYGTLSDDIEYYNLCGVWWLKIIGNWKICKPTSEEYINGDFVVDITRISPRVVQNERMNYDGTFGGYFHPIVGEAGNVQCQDFCCSVEKPRNVTFNVITEEDKVHASNPVDNIRSILKMLNEM